MKLLFILLFFPIAAWSQQGFSAAAGSGSSVGLVFCSTLESPQTLVTQGLQQTYYWTTAVKTVAKSGLRFYPNKIENPRQQIVTITDMMGRCIYRGKSSVILTDKFKAGAYIVNNKKLLKQ